MKLLYSGSNRLSFDDTDRGGIRVVFSPGEEKILRDEDIEKSPSLQRALTDGTLVKTGTEEPGTGTAWEDTSGGATESSHTHANKAQLDLMDMSAKGDLITATADDTPAILGVGGDGEVLTADAAEPTGMKWAAPSAGGGGRWTFVNEFTTTASGSLVISGLDLDADEEYRLEYTFSNEINDQLIPGIQVNSDTSFILPLGGSTDNKYSTQGPIWAVTESGMPAADGVSIAKSFTSAVMDIYKIQAPNGPAVVFHPKHIIQQGFFVVDESTASIIFNYGGENPKSWYPQRGGVDPYANLTSLTFLAGNTGTPWLSATPTRNFTAGDKVRVYKRA